MTLVQNYLDCRHKNIRKSEKLKLVAQTKNFSKLVTQTRNFSKLVAKTRNFSKFVAQTRFFSNCDIGLRRGFKTEKKGTEGAPKVRDNCPPFPFFKPSSQPRLGYQKAKPGDERMD